jgi:RNA recognition motif-containing protein
MAHDDEVDDKESRTIFVGGLSEKMTEAVLYELFYQAGEQNQTFKS